MKVFTKYITLKNGSRIYATDYGIKAFCFEVKEKKKKPDRFDVESTERGCRA